MTEEPWLVVMALPLEAQDVFERAGIPVLYTGVGKVNAAMTLTRALAGYRQAGRSLPHVVNFGSAGSRRFADWNRRRLHLLFTSATWMSAGLASLRARHPMKRSRQ